jgi:hypothetical protein
LEEDTVGGVDGKGWVKGVGQEGVEVDRREAKIRSIRGVKGKQR